MTTTGTAPSVAASEPGRFLLPREPRLTVSLLNPFARVRALPPPFDTKPTFYLFWARNALYHGLHVLGLSAGDTVLVPAFHCATLVEPLVQHGVTVRFYRVDRDCVPDLDDIRTKIDEKNTSRSDDPLFWIPGTHPRSAGSLYASRSVLDRGLRTPARRAGSGRSSG